MAEYNTVRLHRAIQNIIPADKMAGRAEAILTARDAKLTTAQEARKPSDSGIESRPETDLEN